MRLRVDPEELCGVDVSISLRRAEARVAEELLDRTQIGAALQQMRRKRVTQGVRAHTGPHAARRGIAAHEAIDTAHSESGSAIVDEERFGRAARTDACSFASANERLAILEILENR